MKFSPELLRTKLVDAFENAGLSADSLREATPNNSRLVVTYQRDNAPDEPLHHGALVVNFDTSLQAQMAVQLVPQAAADLARRNNESVRQCLAVQPA